MVYVDRWIMKFVVVPFLYTNLLFYIFNGLPLWSSFEVGLFNIFNRSLLTGCMITQSSVPTLSFNGWRDVD